MWSARFAGPEASDEDNNQRLLRELAERPGAPRTARYRCVLALVHRADDPRPLLAQGSWEGRIGFSPAGSGGFGYDPIFVPAGYDQTFAELSPEIKNTISHRGKAVRKMVDFLKEKTKV